MLCLAKTLKFCIIFSVKLAGPSQIAKLTGNTTKNSKSCDELFLFLRAALTSMANSNWFIFSYCFYHPVNIFFSDFKNWKKLSSCEKCIKVFF